MEMGTQHRFPTLHSLCPCCPRGGLMSPLTWQGLLFEINFFCVFSSCLGFYTHLIQFYFLEIKFPLLLPIYFLLYEKGSCVKEERAFFLACAVISQDFYCYVASPGHRPRAVRPSQGEAQAVKSPQRIPEQTQGFLCRDGQKIK